MMSGYIKAFVIVIGLIVGNNLITNAMKANLLKAAIKAGMEVEVNG